MVCAMKKAGVFSILFVVMLFAVAIIAEAQTPAKIPRIGFLFMGSKDQPHLDSFHQGLRERGYVENKNIAIEYRYAEGKLDAVGACSGTRRAKC